MTASSPGNLAPPPVAATVHIYRGLMDRCYTWRTRIDNPTNWAVATTGATTSLVLGEPSISHAVLLLIMCFTCSFLVIEARRYRYYDLWASWARLLETDFFATAVADNQITVGESWQKLIVQEMNYPHFKTSVVSAVGRRLRDNYLVIFMFLLFTWLLKLIIHPLIPMQASSFDLARGAAIGPLSGLWVCAGVLFGYSVLIAIAFITRNERESSVETMSRSRLLQKLASPYQQPVSRRAHAAEQLAHEQMRMPTSELLSTRPVDLED